MFLFMLLTIFLFSRDVVGDENKEDEKKAPPNILFMMADQMRFDAASYTYYMSGKTPPKASQTPNLDDIAVNGAAFLSSWSSTPTCTPARAAILTGQRPWKHGMLGYGAVAQKYPFEFPRILRDMGGYRTVTVGKDHFGWNTTSNNGISHGYSNLTLYDGLGSWNLTKKIVTGEFDQYTQWFERELPGQDPLATLDDKLNLTESWNTWYGSSYIYDERVHPTRWVGDQALAFLQRDDVKEKPFLLKVSFHRPHSPYDPPERLLAQIEAEDLPSKVICANETSPADDTGHGDSWCVRFRGKENDDPIGCGSSDPNAWCGLMPLSNETLSRRAYAASVRFVDEQIGRIMHVLKEQNLLENTFVFFTSDHGDGQGTHHHWRKGYPYEFSAHVPLVMRWPESYDSKIPRGTAIRAPVVTELRDLFHTFIDVANLTESLSAVLPSNHFDANDGKSLLCLLQDSSGLEHCSYEINPGPWREWIDMEHSTCYNQSNHWNALTDGREKYVFRAWYGDEQFFDMEQDPNEISEVSREREDDVALWRKRLVEQFKSEGRGSKWVDPSDGSLKRRTQGTTYSPNYPEGPDRAVTVITTNSKYDRALLIHDFVPRRSRAFICSFKAACVLCITIFQSKRIGFSFQKCRDECCSHGRSIWIHFIYTSPQSVLKISHNPWSISSTTTPSI